MRGQRRNKGFGIVGTAGAARAIVFDGVLSPESLREKEPKRVAAMVATTKRRRSPCWPPHLGTHARYLEVHG